MRVIDPSVEFCGYTPLTPAEQWPFIEMAGRTCYKSEDKITDQSAVGFAGKLFAAGHWAMIEHSNFVVRAPSEMRGVPWVQLLGHGSFLTVARHTGGVYIGGNLTAWLNFYLSTRAAGLTLALLRPFQTLYLRMFNTPGPCCWAKDDRRPQWQPVFDIEEIPRPLRRVSAKLITNRAVTHEIVRHRPCSFGQESQRYCRYGQDKFGGQVTFIRPVFYAEDSAEYAIWEASMAAAERDYLRLLQTSSPQAARNVLPNSCKTEIVITADLPEWEHIFRLRDSPQADPEMQRAAKLLRAAFDERGIPLNLAPPAVVEPGEVPAGGQEAAQC